jgi:hypothetical protein
VKSFFRIILFLTIGVLLGPVFDKLKSAGLPQWAVSLLFFSLLTTISQILLIIKISKNIKFLPTTPESFYGLKTDLLDDYTQQLTSIGFINSSDYQIADFTPSIFLRVFFNPEQKCLAVISQPSSSLMRCTIRSSFTNGWDLANLNYRTDTFKSCSSQVWLRHQRRLWVSQPDAKLAKVLASHLERRQQLVRDLDLKIIEDLTLDSYFEYERMALKFYSRNLKRKWMIVGLIQAFWLFLHPKTEWMGEYQARLDILKNSAF